MTWKFRSWLMTLFIELKESMPFWACCQKMIGTMFFPKDQWIDLTVNFNCKCSWLFMFIINIPPLVIHHHQKRSYSLVESHPGGTFSKGRCQREGQGSTSSGYRDCTFTYNSQVRDEGCRMIADSDDSGVQIGGQKKTRVECFFVNWDVDVASVFF